MKLNVFTVTGNNEACNTYIIRGQNTCIIIDPSCDSKQLKKVIENRLVEGILLTHGHYDHFMSLVPLLALTECKIYLHKECAKKLNNVDASYAKVFGHFEETIINHDRMHFITDLEEIAFELAAVTALATPGHTNCSVSYIIDDMIFSGDFLFKSVIGRTDLITSSDVEMQKSIIKIKRFLENGDFTVFPGHGESTTLQQEVSHNRFLQ